MFLPLFYANMIKAFQTEVKIIQYHGISDSGSKPIHVSLDTVLARLLIVGSCGRVQLCESRMTRKRSTNYAEAFLFCYYENGIRVLFQKNEMRILLFAAAETALAASEKTPGPFC